MMLFENRCLWIRRWLPVLVGMVAGIVTGLLHPTHFFNGRTVFWISLVLSVIAWVYLLAVGRRGDERWLSDLMGGDLALFVAGTAGVVMKYTHDIPQSILFGIAVGVLCFTLLRSVQYWRDDRIAPMGNGWHQT